MTDNFDGIPPSEDASESALPQSEIARIASQLKGLITPERKDDAQEYREDLVGALAQLTIALKEYLKECDTIIVDEAHGHIPGLLVWDIAKKIRRREGKELPHIHFIVGSTTLEDGSAKRESLIRKAYGRGEIGSEILIVTEQARSGETATGLGNAIVKGAETAHKERPRVSIASVSISTHAGKLIRESNYKWYYGSRGAVGSQAFHQDPVTSIGYSDHSAYPRKLSPEAEGADAQTTYTDVAMLVEEFEKLGLLRAR